MIITYFVKRKFLFLIINQRVKRRKVKIIVKQKNDKNDLSLQIIPWELKWKTVRGRKNVVIENREQKILIGLHWFVISLTNWALTEWYVWILSQSKTI
jgi:hypothetical protein